MKWLLLITSLACGCQSISQNEPHQAADKPGSMMHGWRFEQRKEPTVKGKMGNTATGKQLYKKHCLKCHGPTGKGDGAVAAIMDTRPADLTKSNFQEKRHFFYVVSEGSVHGMPAWKSVLSTKQMDDIISYLDTLVSN